MIRRKFGEGTIRLHENGLWEGRIIVRKNGYKPFVKYASELGSKISKSLTSQYSTL